MINRYEWVKRHHVELLEHDVEAPLSVGNGELAFGVDLTGMQTFYELYQETAPLCTMSQWGYHTTPYNSKGGIYTWDDLALTTYETDKGQMAYGVNPMPGNEAVYHWLRENPHRFNLIRIGLKFHGRDMEKEDLSHPHQILELYHGRITSTFKIQGVLCKVITLCDPFSDTLAFEVTSDLLETGDLTVFFDFPYASPTLTGADFVTDMPHESTLIPIHEKQFSIRRTMDQTQYTVNIKGTAAGTVTQEHNHNFSWSFATNRVAFTVSLRQDGLTPTPCYQDVAKRSYDWWTNFWEMGGAIDFSKCQDKRAHELERRMVLSLYQSAIHGCGSMPPQETGLACNSWYGKFHLEMHPLHSLFLPLWHRGTLLKRSLDWYQDHLQVAYDNAKRNGYQGARWPKMVASDGQDSPSWIATLLIWQQPHILYLLETLYQSSKEAALIEVWLPLVMATADFMCDFAIWNETKQQFDLKGPLIPVQEEHAPMDTLNPAFEVAYWGFGLNLVAKWVERSRDASKYLEKIQHYRHVANHMAPLPQNQGLYQAHEACLNTFEAFNKDHPSMLMAFGFIPNEKVDVSIMRQTYKKVLETWQYDTLWGWDFAMMAMTAVRLGEPEWAIEALLMDTSKNHYVKNGQNFQRTRKDLPVYLPGNGSLLLSLAMMTAGFGMQQTPCMGFPKDGLWDDIEYESILGLPY